MADLVEKRPHRFGATIEVLQSADGTKVLVPVSTGFLEFLDEVRQAAPQVHIRVGWLVRIYGRSSRFPRLHRR